MWLTWCCVRTREPEEAAWRVLEGACRAAPTVLALVLGSKSPCCSESTRLSSVVRAELCIKNVISFHKRYVTCLWSRFFYVGNIKISIRSDICFNQISQIILLIIVAITDDHKYFPILILGKHQCHFSPLKNLPCHTPDSCYRDSNVSNSQQSKYNM